MSLHRSLKSADAMQRHRNVLTRSERLQKLEEEKRWDEDESVLGLPKVRSVKRVGKKKKKTKEDEATAAE
jgi:small basic protein (TIGR04137 family)